VGILLGGSAGLRREVEASSLDALGAASVIDSVEYYDAKAALWRLRGDRARARPYVDSVVAVARSTIRGMTTTNPPKWAQFDYYGQYALLLAEQGDRVGALDALARSRENPLLRLIPNGGDAMLDACYGAHVYAFLGDIDQMVTELRHGLALPIGISSTEVRNDPAFRPYLDDSRLRALLTGGR